LLEFQHIGKGRSIPSHLPWLANPRKKEDQEFSVFSTISFVLEPQSANRHCAPIPSINSPALAQSGPVRKTRNVRWRH
jgi:hypothetical protein